MVIRCPECKCALQLRSLTRSEEAQVEPVEMSAAYSHAGDIAAAPVPESSAPTRVGPPRLDASAAELTVVSPRVDENDVLGEDAFELPVPQPARLRFGGGRRSRRSATARRSDKPNRDVGLAHRRSVADFKGIELSGSDDDGPTEDEYRFLARFFALCVAVLGLVLIVPSAMVWSGWQAFPTYPSGSRWIFVMIFLGGLHLVYAVFLYQLAEGTALWAVAIFLLVIGCIQGVFTAGTYLDYGTGPISGFLQLPPGESATVTLWYFLHLCLAVALCYLCGRQAIWWRRSRQRGLGQ
jgi:hypothetical protein